MGMELAMGAMAAVSIGSSIFEMGADENAAAANKYALDQESKELKLQYMQKTLSNYDVMDKLLQSQEAAMTVTGTAFSSPSFNAIQRQTLNVGAKQQKDTDIEEDIAQLNISTEKQNVKNSLYSKIFGDVAGIAKNTSDFMSKIPTFGEG